MLINPNLARQQTPPQNLVSQVSPERAAHPKGYYAGMALDLVSVGSAVFLGWAYRAYFAASGSVIVPLLGLAFFVVPTLLSVLLVKHRTRRVAVSVLQVIGIAAWFFHPGSLSDPFFLSGALLAVILLVIADERGKQAYDNSLKIRFAHCMRSPLRIMLTALVLMGILFTIPKGDAAERFVSRGAFDKIFAQGASLAKRWYPALDAEGSFKSFAQAAAEREAATDPRVGALPAAMRAQVISQAVDQFLGDAEKFFGIEVNPEERLGTVFYRYATGKIASWHEQSRNIFFLGWVAFLFFLFRGIAFLAYYPLLGITRFVFELLIAGNVIHMSGEMRLHEIVEYS